MNPGQQLAFDLDALPLVMAQDEAYKSMGATAAPAVAARHARTPRARTLDHAANAAREGLSGPRSSHDDPSRRPGLDSPEDALRASRCRCERPLAMADEELHEVRCLRCGKRP